MARDPAEAINCSLARRPLRMNWGLAAAIQNGGAVLHRRRLDDDILVAPVIAVMREAAPLVPGLAQRKASSS